MDGITEADRRHMRRALELAERGWGRVAPNPMVGAVVVRNGERVGEGWHAEYGRAHAEPEALRHAGERARGATVYVSLEPCNHQGKTPPCTEALIRAGVARVVYACADPNPKAQGGADRLREAGVEVVGGVEEAAARDLNARFLHAVGPAGWERPWIELKLAMSLDARIADREGRSAWITGEAARAEVHRLRAAADAIAVGIGTALADDPLLTVRGAIQPARPPVRVVFDRHLRLPPGSRLLRTVAEAPLWLVAGSDVSDEARGRVEDAGARVLVAGDLLEGLRLLAAEGIAALLCEGGASLAAALLDARVVDRLDVFYAPVLLGPEARSPFAGLPSPPLARARRWRRLATRALGDDTLVQLAP